MVADTATPKEQNGQSTSKLPLLYASLTPVLAEKHGNLSLKEAANYSFAAKAAAIPVTVDEFANVQRNYPIVITGDDHPMPVALMGFQPHVNDQVNADGTWQKGRYIPAYVRRYPFCLLRESEEAERLVLCADIGSDLFENDGPADRRLFEGDGPSKLGKDMLDFCKEFDAAMARTRSVMQECVSLNLIEDSVVNIKRGDKTARVEGFKMISEEKTRALEDAKLADFSRRGIMHLLAAHHMSFSAFSQVAPT